MMHLLVLAPFAHAQELPLPALSPRAEVAQEVGVVELRVSYASPAKRERQVWGELVPYDKLWRTGANAATTLETDGPIRIGDAEVPAGTYALFTIPGEKTWTVIVNRDADQRGTGSYDASVDVARIEVEPEVGAARERLTFVFSDTTAERTRLDLEWDGLRVGIPISVDTQGLVAEHVSTFTASTAGRMTQAARHYARVGDVDEALRLVNTAIDLQETWYSVWIKAQILRDDGKRRQAWREAKRAQALGEKDDDFFYRERVEEAVRTWRRG